MSTIEDAYRTAETFQDVCDINILFLQGVYDHTAYHCAKVDEETIPLLDDLVHLNKRGLYTFNGQPAINEIMEQCVFHKTYTWTCLQQRGYLDALIQAKYMPALKIYLDEQYKNGIYYMFEYPSGRIECNIPFGRMKSYPLYRTAHIVSGGFSITKEMYELMTPTINDWQISYNTSIGKYTHELKHQVELHEYAGINPEIFKDCGMITLTTRDFYAKASLEKCMLKFYDLVTFCETK